MKTVEYQLTAEFIELNHLMKLCGFADSGGSGGALVASGAVSVDGKVELRKRNKIRGGQVVMVEDTEIHVLAGENIPVKPPKVIAKPARGKAQPYRPRRKPGAPKSGG